MSLLSSSQSLVWKLPDELVRGNKKKKWLEVPRNGDPARLLDCEPPGCTVQCDKAPLLLGTIEMVAGPHLVVVTRTDRVGPFFTADASASTNVVWRCRQLELVPYEPARVDRLTGDRALDQIHCEQLAQFMMTRQAYYFSYSFDLSQSLLVSSRAKRSSNSSSSSSSTAGVHQDGRFNFTEPLRNQLFQGCPQALVDQCAPPVILGFIGYAANCRTGTTTTTGSGRKFTFVLVSRRSRFRVGTRFNRRGLDKDGNVANQVETEQLLFVSGGAGDTVTSFVQSRGSIPLFWSQRACIKYKPKPKLAGSVATAAPAASSHFAEQLSRYSQLVMVNLIDQRGSERVLEEAFQTLVDSELPEPQRRRLRYVPFDFHHECRKMQWHRLSLLVDQVADDLESFGWTQVQAGGDDDGAAGKPVERLQKGAMRVNCMDNLDRTNVVEGLFARWSLERQLRAVGLLPDGSRGWDDEFERVRRAIWSDNADFISVQYSGTGALKTDFTRTGKRTKRGLLNDGVNSATRYYLNNYEDGWRQDAWDYFASGSRWGQRKAGKPSFAHFILLILALVAFFVSTSTRVGGPLKLIVFIIILFVHYRVMIQFSSKFVNQPSIVN